MQGRLNFTGRIDRFCAYRRRWFSKVRGKRGRPWEGNRRRCLGDSLLQDGLSNRGYRCRGRRGILGFDCHLSRSHTTQFGTTAKAEFVEVLVFLAAARTNNHERSSAEISLREWGFPTVWFISSDLHSEEFLPDEDIVTMR